MNRPQLKPLPLPHRATVLLAAGKSERMGIPKALVPFQGKPWIVWQIQQIQALHQGPLCVVLGFHHESIATMIKTHFGERHLLALNAQPERGTYSSIQTGLQCVLRTFESVDAIYILPIDVPCPLLSTWYQLSHEWNSHIHACVPIHKDRIRGAHPVLLSRRLAYSIIKDDPSRGRLDEKLKTLPQNELLRIEVDDPLITLNLNTPDEFDHWRSASETQTLDVVARDSARLALVETGLGSLLHGFHIPLAGQALSLNQIFFLTLHTLGFLNRSSQKPSPAAVSLVTACLKSLSPAGKKLTPMLAISAQGFLYSVGPHLFGSTFCGALVGGVLSSVWAFVQPFLLALIFYGELSKEVWMSLSRMVERLPFNDSLSLARLLCIAVGIKALLAVVVVSLARFAPRSWKESTMIHLTGLARRQTAIKRRKRIPSVILLSAITTIALLFFSESPWSTRIWIMLRPIGAFLCLMVILRMTPWHRIQRRLQFTRWNRIVQSIGHARAYLLSFNLDEAAREE